MKLFVVMLIISQAGGVSEPAYPLEFKSIVVEYKFSGVIEGKETFAVLNSGETILLDAHLRMPEKNIDSLWVLTPNKGYKIINGDTTELTLGEIFIIRYVTFTLMKALLTGSPPAKGAPFRKVGTEKVLDRECDIFETQYMRKNTRISSYKGIPLLYLWTESDTGFVTKEAVKLEIDKEFTHPLLDMIQK